MRSSIVLWARVSPAIATTTVVSKEVVASNNDFVTIRRYPRTTAMRRKLWIVTFCREIPALRNLCFWAQGRGVVAHPSIYVQTNDATNMDDGDDGISSIRDRAAKIKGTNNDIDALKAFEEMLDESIGMERRDVYTLVVDRPIPAGTTLLSIPLDRDGDEFRKKEYLSGRVAFAPESDDHGRIPSFFGDDPEIIKQRTCVMRTRMSRNSRSSAHLMVGSDGRSIRGDTSFNQMNDPSFSHLVEKSARGLYSTGYPFRPYLEFLHDLHNSSGSEDGDDEESGDSPYVAAAHGDTQPRRQQPVSSASKEQSTGFAPVDVYNINQADMDEITMGNDLTIHGVENAPFLKLADVRTAKGKSSLVWAQRSAHQMALGLPHFCSGAVAWAQSMVLSRGFVIDSVPPTDTYLPKPTLLPCIPTVAPDDVEKIAPSTPRAPTALPICAKSNQEIALVPLMDFCGHASNPSSHYCISVPSNNGINYGQTHKNDKRRPAVGVKGWRQDRANIHLVALRDMCKGDEVTIKYMDSTFDEEEDSSSGRMDNHNGGGSDKTSSFQKKRKWNEVRDLWKVRYGLDLRNNSKTVGGGDDDPSFYTLSQRLVDVVKQRFATRQ